MKHLKRVKVHEHIAEPLAESSAVKKGDKHPDRVPKDAFQKLSLEKVDQRWVAPSTTLMELRETALAFMDTDPCNDAAGASTGGPSYPTFCRAFHRGWVNRIKFRTEGQHALCTDSARWKAFRKNAFSQQDIARCKLGLQAHLASMMADRRLDASLNQLAADAVSGAGERSSDGLVAPLSMTIDAMDSSKFLLPRNLANTKQFQALHKAEVKMICVLVEGLEEFYFIMHPGVAKDSNLQMSLLTHVLGLVRGRLAAAGGGIAEMPRDLRVHSDNAPSEGKNQHVMKWAGALVAENYFEKVTLTMFRCGHSHSKIDQRFSEVRNALHESPVLETPEDFKKAIEERVKPRAGRRLSVEIVHGSHDFKAHFDTLGVTVSGHTQTHEKFMKFEQAVHYFAFETLDRHLRDNNCNEGDIMNTFGLPMRLGLV